MVFAGQSHLSEGGALTRSVEICRSRARIGYGKYCTGSSVHEEPFARPEVWEALQAVIRERADT